MFSVPVLIWLVTVVGFIGYLLVTHHAKLRLIHDSEQSRMERIARLEIQTKVGLVYARDYVLAQPLVPVRVYMKNLLDKGNGAVVRLCLTCENDFRQFDHERESRHTELSDRLCTECLPGALAANTAFLEV